MAQFSPYTVVLVFAGVSLLWLARLVWRVRSKAGGRVFAVALVQMAVYALGYAGQVTATSLPGKLFWLKVQYLGLAALPAVLLLFATDYVGRERWTSRRTMVALAVAPAVALVLVWTEPGHGLYLVDPHVRQVGGFRDLEYGLSGGGFAFWVYQYLLFAVTVLLFLSLAGHRNAAYRKQGRVLALGLGFPMLVGLVTLSDVFWLDLTPVAFLVTGAAVTWGVYRAQLLDVVPVDREQTFEQIRGAVFVLDAEGRVVDSNRRAREFAGGEPVTGRDVDELLADAGCERRLAELEDGDTVERDAGDPRQYEVGRERIETRFGDPRGTVLTLYDISDRWRLEERLHRQNDQLAVLNRLLRHDVRNEVAVIQGWGAELRDRLTDERDREMLDAMLSAADNAEKLTDDARHLAESAVDDGEMDLKPVDVGRVLRESIATVQASHEAADVDPPDAYPGATVEANELLSSVFTNLLNNAVQHNDRDEPRVDVGMRVDGDVVRVRLADDGPGIPDDRKAEMFDRGRAGLDSAGTGLGLYLVSQLLAEFGGRVEVGDNEPRGTVFVVELPLAPEGEGLQGEDFSCEGASGEP